MRSGVNWIRANVPWTVVASVSAARVFARPGTPSIRQWPASEQAHHEPLDHAVLPDDDALDLEQRALEPCGRLGDGGRIGGLRRHCAPREGGKSRSGFYVARTGLDFGRSGQPQEKGLDDRPQGVAGSKR